MTQLEYFFSDYYVVLRPDRCSAFSLLRLLFSSRVWENKAVDCLWGTEVRDRRRRWAMFVSLLAQMILLRVRVIVAVLGAALEVFFNMLRENEGFLKLAVNVVRGKIVIPTKSSPSYRSIMGLTDTRFEVDKRYRSNNGIQYHAEISVMAAKLAFENESFIRHIVTKKWQMEFLNFLDCWNDFEDRPSTQAFLFFDKLIDSELIVVAFRGTKPYDSTQWSTNFDLSWFDIPRLGKVHAGFAKALGLLKHIGWPKIVDQDTLRKQYAYYAIREKLREFLQKNKRAKFLVTGHSSGGALAILFATLLAYHEEEFLLDRLEGVYTFGQPHVGDEILGEFVERKLNKSKTERRYFRFVYCNDIFPRLPYDTSSVPLLKHFGVRASFNSIYQHQVFHDEQYDNYFSPRHSILMYFNSSFEFLRSFLIALLWGSGYREGHLLLFLRGLAWVFPWFSFHFVQDYVNSVRRGISRHKDNKDVREQDNVNVLSTFTDNDSPTKLEDNFDSCTLPLTSEDMAQSIIKRETVECNSYTFEEKQWRNNSLFTNKLFSGEVENSKSKNLHNFGADTCATSVSGKYNISNSKNLFSNFSTGISVIPIDEDNKTSTNMLNVEKKENHTLVLSIDEVIKSEQETRLSSFSFPLIHEVDADTEIQKSAFISDDEVNKNERDEEGDPINKEQNNKESPEDKDFQSSAHVYMDDGCHRWSWKRSAIGISLLSTHDYVDIESMLEKMSSMPIIADDVGTQYEGVEAKVEQDLHTESSDTEENIDDEIPDRIVGDSILLHEKKETAIHAMEDPTLFDSMEEAGDRQSHDVHVDSVPISQHENVVSQHENVFENGSSMAKEQHEQGLRDCTSVDPRIKNIRVGGEGHTSVPFSYSSSWLDEGKQVTSDKAGISAMDNNESNYENMLKSHTASVLSNSVHFHEAESAPNITVGAFQVSDGDEFVKHVTTSDALTLPGEKNAIQLSNATQLQCEDRSDRIAIVDDGPSPFLLEPKDDFEKDTANLKSVQVLERDRDQADEIQLHDVQLPAPSVGVRHRNTKVRHED